MSLSLATPLTRSLTRGLIPTAFNPNLPLTIPNLELWLDADDASTFTFGTGTDVSVWADKSTTGTNATQGTAAAQPKRVDDSGSGKKTVEYFGGDVLACTPPLSGVELSFFLVYKTTAVGAPGTKVLLNVGAAFLVQKGGGPGPYQVAGLAASLFDTTVNRIASNVFTSSFTEVFFNGVSIGTGSGGSGSAIQLSAVGSANFLGTISELIMYDRFLTIDERQALEQFQSTKWNIALG